MKFVIRDDDLNYFSTPADIERWYADVFALGVRVGFAAIPFVRGTSDVYTAYAPKDAVEYPIGKNRELAEYVKTHPFIEIVQHGCTHETKDGIFEYRRTEGLVEETARGKAEIASVFGDSFKNVFAPPHDWIGSHGVLAVEAAQMNIIRGRGAGLRNWILRWEYVVNFIRMFIFKLSYRIQGVVEPAYPYVIDFGRHQEATSYRLEDADVFEGLERAHKKDGIFVVVTHLHFYTPEKKALLLQLIAKARAYNAGFVTPSDLFN